MAEAKDAWKRRQESAKDTTGNVSPYTGNFNLNVLAPVISDPDDPRFDLEKLILKLEKSS